MDELSKFFPKLCKSLSPKTRFLRVHFYWEGLAQTDDKTLYIADMGHLLKGKTNLPKNLIVIGGEASVLNFENQEVLIQISGTDCETIMEKIFDVYLDFNQWDQRLMTAVLSHAEVEEFLKIAAEKLSNPVAFFDNGLTAMATAGSFVQSTEGTIWEKIAIPGYPLADFFTLKEQQALSLKMQKQVDKPYLYQPVLDPRHTYASTHIWIDQKLCGNLGQVDINEPFSEGQLEILWHIGKRLTDYLKINDSYRDLAKNQTNFIKDLFEEKMADEKSIDFHLTRLGLKRRGDYYLLSFICPMTISTPIEIMSYVKRIHPYYPDGVISVHDDLIILLVDKNIYPLASLAEQERLTGLLLKYEMKCGISLCFHDLLKLRYAYLQSRFGAENGVNENNEEAQRFCFYECCYQEHLFSLLGQGIDLPVLCAPDILEMVQVRESNERELIQCLRIYLLHGRNLASASKALNVHRNTLIYRIDKIARRLKMDLDQLSEDEIFYLIFSCMVAESRFV
jgi:hypothetical protein